MTDPDPSDLRDVDEADVYLDDQPVATLRRTTGDTITFEYTAPPPSGVSVRATSVSWSLPASVRGPVITTGASVPAYFAGLLPEGCSVGSGRVVD